MRTLLPVSLLAGSFLPALAAQSPPCFESNLGTDLQLGDDDVAQSRALGFAFPFAGRSTSVVSISSNGFVWLGSNGDSACCNGDGADFLSMMARIAAVWTDLDPSSGGSVHFATFPGRAAITWSAVPEYGQSNAITAQVQLLANGSIVLAWQAPLGVDSHTTLAGVTPGGGAPGVRVTDFTRSLPLDTGTSPTVYELFNSQTIDLGGLVVEFTPNGTGGYRIARRTDCQFAGFFELGAGCPASLPVTLFAASGSRPAIGTNFDMIVGEAPSAPGAGVMLYGGAAGGISLGGLGMPGCTLYAAGDVVVPFPIQGRYSVVTLPIPLVQTLVGGVLHGQAALVAPGTNARGIVTSNGGRIEIGR